jgi:hypothetical protein
MQTDNVVAILRKVVFPLVNRKMRGNFTCVQLGHFSRSYIVSIIWEKIKKNLRQKISPNCS